MGPYREPAEDAEAAVDAREVAAFKASLVRRGNEVRVGVILVVLASVVGAATLASMALQESPPVARARREPHCEVHTLQPASGELIPMTVCY